jgi:AcrR family transcriptional regulator
MKADDRRVLALRAAVIEFGRSGYRATSTASIAERMGVSQPYLFRLFKSKKHLFAAAAGWSLSEFSRLLDRAADGRTGVDVLDYLTEDLIKPSSAHRDLLRFELALYAAAGDSELAKLARRHFDFFCYEVARVSGADEPELTDFLGRISVLIIRAMIDDWGR